MSFQIVDGKVVETVEVGGVATEHTYTADQLVEVLQAITNQQGELVDRKSRFQEMLDALQA